MRNLMIIAGTLLMILLQGTACGKNNSVNQDADPSDTSTTTPLKILRSNLSYPWEILWGYDDHIWLTERAGKISKLNPSDGSTVFSAGIDEVEARGEGGLLGMAQDPDFLNNGFLYVVYNYIKNGNYTEKLVRLKFDNNALTQPHTLIDDIPASNIHNGSRLWITEGSNGKIFMSTGDAANSANAQAAGSRSGKILRINKDGSIPADNPIAGNLLWSFGHRNPQGMVMVNNILFTAEHGPDVEDEVNIVQKGKNYGWPQVNGPCNGSETSFCSANGVVEPIWSTGGSTFALSGMDYYDHDLIPEWKNCLLVASLKNTTLYVLHLNDQRTAISSSEEYFNGQFGRLRDICISPSGTVYICTSNGQNDALIAVNARQK